MSTRPQTTFAALALTLFFGTLAVAGGPAGTVSTRRTDARRRCAILAEPVRGIRPAQLAVPGSLESRTARRTPMLFAGYGFTELGPDGDVPPPSEWDGWRRIKASKMDRVVDQTWASWELPSRVCFGDSGGGTVFNARPAGRPFDVSLVAVASDGGIDCLKPDYRARVDTAAVRRWIDEILQQHLSRVR